MVLHTYRYKLIRYGTERKFRHIGTYKSLYTRSILETKSRLHGGSPPSLNNFISDTAVGSTELQLDSTAVSGQGLTETN